MILGPLWQKRVFKKLFKPRNGVENLRDSLVTRESIGRDDTLAFPSASEVIPTVLPTHNNAADVGDLGMPLLNDLAHHPDAQSRMSTRQENSRIKRQLSRKSTLTKKSGVLHKRTTGRFVAARWLPRYFVVEGTAFCYWDSEDQYLAGNAPNKNIVFTLKGYDVRVNPNDPSWGFVLEPVDDSDRRAFEFRANDENDRLEWVEVFYAGSLNAINEVAEDRPYDLALGAHFMHTSAATRGVNVEIRSA